MLNNRILLVFPIITCLSCLSGCKSTTPPEELRPYYTGRWELTYADRPDSSNWVHKHWLTLYSDQTFSSTSSFFLKTDSTSTQPINDTWNVTQSYADLNGHTYNEIYISADSISNSWLISGSNQAGYMGWGRDYLWSLVR